MKVIKTDLSPKFWVLFKSRTASSSDESKKILTAGLDALAWVDVSNDVYNSNAMTEVMESLNKEESWTL
jgi:hypothetical protein